MKIYTGMTSGKKFDIIKKYDMGIMISSSPHASITNNLKSVSCALDNGAFSCYEKGYPFQEDIFLNTIKKCYKFSINLDFIVAPDILQGGLTSLELSMRWAKWPLLGTKHLALVVQDGMKIENISVGYHLENFSHIFVGGSKKWKFETAEEWVDFAHSNNMKCHIGQVGALENLYKQIPFKGRWLCWDKRSDGVDDPTNADGGFGGQFELAWISKDVGNYKIFRLKHGGFVNRDGGKRLHPTQKPVRLLINILEHYKSGESVLDFFLGSGSTLIAAEQSGRTCSGMELDPYYIDVILKRYMKLYPAAIIECMNRKFNFKKLLVDK